MIRVLCVKPQGLLLSWRYSPAFLGDKGRSGGYNVLRLTRKIRFASTWRHSSQCYSPHLTGSKYPQVPTCYIKGRPCESGKSSPSKMCVGDQKWRCTDRINGWKRFGDHFTIHSWSFSKIAISLLANARAVSFLGLYDVEKATLFVDGIREIARASPPSTLRTTIWTVTRSSSPWHLSGNNKGRQIDCAITWLPSWVPLRTWQMSTILGTGNI